MRAEHPHQLLSAHEARELAYTRQGGWCARCSERMPIDGYEAHHRRRRRVLGWCMCNVVALHPRCHTMGPLAVHDHPELARQLGLIVPTWGDEPCSIPLRVSWPWEGQALLSCTGLVCSVDARDICA
jgi:hypothetical protein